ncbi:uncharacterized protein BP01DRAFT_384152 [Aspergillus saccharolyticus JOP 1030-1]|uniref:Plastocyanin-like domain-containing protein n=1 Tax=Aspergillus saccharolyticus JOP 1030-1 TaxID=1450539 RepID=A0A318ZUL0_9EURO|nr:hypothetical protein BP01DRAFT_384152 [Aspergillus saccharolyticus JOP 1030-1]PYH43768.1 hypothetical protein BP01DRAFT_384152 [Aspergillus saccharolyticus JOP 1030-1]
MLLQRSGRLISKQKQQGRRGGPAAGWDITTVDELYRTAQTDGPPNLDNGLINDTNGDEGTSYRLRAYNAAVDTHVEFMLDNHTISPTRPRLLHPGAGKWDVRWGQPVRLHLWNQQAARKRAFGARVSDG